MFQKDELLERLTRQHDQIERELEDLYKNPNFDEMLVQHLKKHKLFLKDEYTKLSNGDSHDE